MRWYILPPRLAMHADIHVSQRLSDFLHGFPIKKYTFHDSEISRSRYLLTRRTPSQY